LGFFADAAPFSWLDVTVACALVFLILSIRKRRFWPLISATAALYLFFFWTWGINYHRPPLSSKLPFDAGRATNEHMEGLSRRAAAEINRLYAENQGRSLAYDPTGAVAARRVRHVISVIDGTALDSALHVKTSVVVNPWFQMAGVDGLFNPFPHEPIINPRLLDIERPFVVAHEHAHVRGYPNEGDANLIALLATIMSEDTSLQYSGWLHLWFYLRTRELDALLDEGPRADIQRIFERAREGRIRWVSNFQNTILDWFLKANSVEQGVRSYAQIVVLAAGTEEHWERYR
jgi:hypothetical protein